MGDVQRSFSIRSKEKLFITIRMRESCHPFPIGCWINWSCSAVDSADSGFNTASKCPCSSYDLDLVQQLKSSGSNDWGSFQEATNKSLLEELAKQNFMSFNFNTYWSSVSKLHKISLIFDFLWSHQRLS